MVQLNGTLLLWVFSASLCTEGLRRLPKPYTTLKVQTDIRTQYLRV